MAPGNGAYLAIFLVAATVTFLVTPVVRRLAIWRGAVVAPDSRRVHTTPTPTLGGASMLAGFIGAMALAAQLEAFEGVFAATTEWVGVILAAVIIHLIGAIDDLRDMSAPAKLAGMVLAASLLSFGGISLLYLRIPFADVFVLSPDLSAVLTVVWVVMMANSINLIDGLDGLAAGVVAIAAAAFFLYSVELVDGGLLRPTNIGPLLAIITAGICIGFLPHNLHPAQIFMGDAGSLLLGVLLAASTTSVGGRTAEEFTGQTYFFFAPIFIPLFILAVPIFDLLFTIVRRAVGGSGITAPDKGHVHHRLLALGHGHRRSVAILWLWTAAMSAFVLYPTYTGDSGAIALAGIGVVAILLVVLTWRPTKILGRAQKSRSGLRNEAPSE